MKGLNHVKCTISIPLGYLVQTSYGLGVFPDKGIALEFDNAIDALKALCSVLAKKSWGDSIKPEHISIHFSQITTCDTLINKSELDTLVSGCRKQL